MHFLMTTCMSDNARLGWAAIFTAFGALLHGLWIGGKRWRP